MNPCEDCPLEDKIYECCGRFPDTGESVYMHVDESRRVRACPYLDRMGVCTIYEHRPLGCRSHFCSQYSSRGQIAQEYLDVISNWKRDE